MESLSLTLQEQASADRQAALQDELTSIQQNMGNLQTAIGTRVDDLQETKDRWDSIYRQMDEFTAFLNEMEADLQNVEQMSATPQQQHEQASVSDKRSIQLPSLLYTSSILLLFTKISQRS